MKTRSRAGVGIMKLKSATTLYFSQIPPYILLFAFQSTRTVRLREERQSWRPVSPLSSLIGFGQPVGVVDIVVTGNPDSIFLVGPTAC